MPGRRVLFIAYHFPPQGGPGVQRSLKFVKYLPEFGWQPIVLCGAADAGPVLDASLLNDIPSSAVIRRLGAFNIQSVMSAATRVKLKSAGVFLNLLLQIPDAGIFWARRARRVASELIDAYQPDLIYSTSGPNSSHLAARWIQQDRGLPWLADFRDPWSQNLVIPYLPGYRALNKSLERRVLAAADRVVCVSQPWLDGLQANLGERPDKFVLIPNGYDPDDLPAISLPESGGRFTITHIGSMYRNRRPEGFLTAIQWLLERGEIKPDEIQIRFIGRNNGRIIPQHEPFEIIEYRPHNQLFEFIKETKVLLLLLDTAQVNSGNFSGKIYEYIAANRPILGIVPPSGVAKDLIERTRTGIAVDNDPEQIAAVILRLYRDNQAGFPDFDPDWSEIRKYSRRNLTARLAEVFSDLI